MVSENDDGDARNDVHSAPVSSEVDSKSRSDESIDAPVRTRARFRGRPEITESRVTCTYRGAVHQAKDTSSEPACPVSTPC